MRPRPATWAALLVSAAPVDAALGGEVYAHETAFPKECTFLAHAAGDPSTNPDPKTLVRRFWPAVTAEAGGASPAYSEGPSEEAATPEFPETCRSASLKTLPPVHPREPPVTASSAAVASRLNASHACTVGTLREDRIDRNGKLMLRCAETVEDGTSLWKAMENAVEIRAHGSRRSGLLFEKFPLMIPGRTNP